MKKTEQHSNLSGETDKYRAIFEQAMTSTLILSPAGEILDSNEAACRVFGYDCDALYGETLDFLFGGNPIPVDQADHGSTQGQIEGKTSSDSAKVFNYQYSTLKTEGGRLFGILQLIDTTEQAKETEYLRLLESVVKGANDAVLITTADNLQSPYGPEIVFVNQAFTDMTGYSAEEVIGKTPRILQGSETPGSELKRLRKAINNYEQVETELLNYKKNGDEFWVEISLSPVFDGDRCTHFIAIERDITSRKNQEYLKKLQSDISGIFNHHETMADSIHATLDVLINIGDFCLAELWMVDAEKRKISLTGYKSKDNSADKFYELSQNVQVFMKGEGLPGSTWETGEIQFWRGLNKHEDFVRHKEAQAVGVKTAYGVPIYFGEKVIGMLLLGARVDHQKKRYYTPLLEQLGQGLGLEINRKQTEEELNRIFSFSPDIICVAGLDGYFKKVNPAMSRLLGYTQDELLNHPISSFTHPDDRFKTEAEISALNKNEGNDTFQNRYLSKSGEIVWLSWTTRTFFDEGIIYSIARDITEEKELKDLLKQANRLAKIGGWEVDFINDDHYWSDVTREIHEVEPGYKPNLAEAINFYKEGDSRNRIQEAVEKAIEQGVSFDLEVQIITAKGNERWIRAIGKPELVNGKLVRLYGSFQDIDEKKSIELRLKNISNNIPGVLFKYMMDADGNDSLLYLSEGAVKLWGITPEDAMRDNKLVWDRFQEDDYQTVIESIRQSAETLTQWQVQWRYHHPDGSVRWQEGYGSPHRLADGSTEWDSIIFDVTEKKNVEKLLDKTSRLARIGSWELDMRDGNENQVYWSKVTKEILEVDASYVPTLTEGFEFYCPESRKRIESAVKKAMETGETFDLELLLKTDGGNEKWVRCIGQAEMANGTCVRLYGSFQDIHERKSAEQKQIELSRERERILESIGDGFFTVDQNFIVTYWNKNAEELLETPRDEILHQYLWDRFSDAKGLESYKQYNTALKENRKVSFEDYYPALDRWFEINAYPYGDGLSVFFKDITSRKKARNQILEKTRQLDAIAMFNGLLIKSSHWEGALKRSLETIGKVVDADRVYFFKNRYSDNLKEYTASIRCEWADERAVKINNHPAHQEIPFSKLGEFLPNLTANLPFSSTVDEISDSLFREFLKEENIKSILVIPVFVGGRFYGAIGFDDCTTKRKWSTEETSFLKTIAINLASAIENDEAEQALQKSFKEKNEILESIGDAFFAVNKNWVVTYWNNRAEEVLFMSRDDIVGKKLWDVYEDATELDFYTQYQKAMNKQIMVSFEEYYPTVDKWFDVSAYPSTDGLSVFFKDITDRKKSDEQLKELNRTLKQQTKELAASNAELEQFAFVASHDLQEPLRMVTGFLTQLEKKYSDELDEKAKKYIWFATDGAKRMRRIILDLLDFSRIGRDDAEYETVDLNELLNGVLSLNRNLISDKKAEVSVDNLPEIYASRSSVRQLFLNLINNAIKYHSNDTTPVVEITSEEKEGTWIFSVQDNGIGINPEYSEKIFNIFQRLHGREEYSGTGMGLAICKKIVEEHGGEIWVESEEGAGSTFYFTIPKNGTR